MSDQTIHEAPIEDTDPRDGPTSEFERHHDVVQRTGKAGKRIRSKLEQLLLNGYISPDQSAAGKRFEIDYLKGCIGRERSCLAFGPRGNGGGYPSEVRLEASSNFEQARQALDGCRAPQAVGVSPSDIVLKCCVEDLPFTTLGDIIGKSGEVAKARVSQLLAVLAVHYQAVDRKKGSSTTPHTEAGAIRLFDPDIEDENEEKSV